jgi:hypothetical protein
MLVGDIHKPSLVRVEDPSGKRQHIRVMIVDSSATTGAPDCGDGQVHNDAQLNTKF